MIRHRHRRRKETPELNITAFLNLMVILVPFLLITAVFTKLAVIELNMPAANSSTASEEPELQLSVAVLPTKLIVSDKTGLIQEFTNIQYGNNQFGDNIEDYRWEALSDLIVKIKQRAPEQKNITLRIADNIPYEIAVRTMDSVRSKLVTIDGRKQQAELFPSITIGNVSEAQP